MDFVMSPSVSVTFTKSYGHDKLFEQRSVNFGYLSVVWTLMLVLDVMLYGYTGPGTLEGTDYSHGFKPWV